jgi:5-methyltetrahydropteroyltriglutamate--homocysteine methyltransferase
MSRQHFVHGFLEQVEGIDFAHKVAMGIRAHRYKAMVPQVTGEVRLKGRVHATEAKLARAHTKKKLKITMSGSDDDRRYDRRGAALARKRFG